MAPSNGLPLSPGSRARPGSSKLDLALSDGELARITGLSSSTIARHRRGESISPELLFRLASALIVLELHSPSRPAPIGDVLDGLARPLAVRRPVLVQARCRRSEAWHDSP